MIGLIDMAIVYTPDPTTGAYTVVDKASLPCRLAVVAVAGVDPGPGRVELVDERRLLWGPDYAMPITAQVEIEGARWNVEAGSLAAVRGPDGSIAYRRAKVIKAV
ncbi:MAG TPA: hypothetical protein VI776_02165 [Anaerolineales bacterium]|nr:MAG: hypothetical protein XU14_C0033G0011 [Armatimonadetes bacterium CSP1-3]HLE13524.1 hypothetical protein [Anaerolineales bacterium]